MYRFGITALLGALLLSPIGAADGLSGLFDSLSHDFGNVPVGPSVSHGFTIKNTTNQTLQVGGLRVSCGCTTPSISTNSIAPGQSAVLTATMDTRRFTGPKSVTVFVQFYQPRFEEVRLVVSANGRTDISMNPERFEFGRVRTGESPTAATTVTFLSGMRMTEARCESGYVQLAVSAPKSNGYGLSYELTARLRSDIPVGVWYTDVWVKTDNDTRMRIPLTVTVEPNLSVAPARVEFDAIKVGEPVKKAIVVKGAKPFRILEVKGGDGVIQATATSNEAKTTHLVTVTFKPGKKGDYTKDLEIITDMKDGGTVSLPVKATAKP